MYQDGGLGYAGFSVAKGKLFTMGARGETEFLIALDANTGKELWSAPVGTRYTNRWGDGPRSTPTVDGDKVYTMGGRGDLICANLADGKVLWKKSMTALGGKLQNWGYTESVLVDGDKVVCTPGGPQGAIAAFKKTDGTLLWQSADFTDEAQYSSIIPINHYGKKQYVQLTMKSIVGIDPANGKVLWRSDFPGKTAVIPTPIYKDGYVFVTAGYNVGCKMVQISKDNQVTDVYANMVMKNHHGGVILVGDHLYGHSDGPGWICQDFKTGEQVWANKSVGKGAVGYADGMLYLLDEANGNVVLIEASPKGWSEKGRFKLDPQTTQRSPQGKIWVHPVIVNGKLYLRDQEIILCYDVKK